MKICFLGLCWILLCPFIARADPPGWQAESEEEALFLRRIADFWEEEEYQIAKGQIEQFLAAFPRSTFADPLCVALGDLLLQEKNYSSALNYYAKVTSKELEGKIFLNRMQCFYSLEWYDSLVGECESFLNKENLQPEQKLQATYYLAIALYQQCLNSVKAPETATKIALRAKPYFETLVQSEFAKELTEAFAHLCCILKDFSKAASLYLDLAQKEPDLEEEMLFQAALIQSEYDKELAFRSFGEIAKKGKKKSKEAFYNQLVLSFDLGHFENLIAEKEELLRQIPPERVGAAHLFLGRSFFALKKYSEAIQELQSYVADAPPNESLHAALLCLLETAFQTNDLTALDVAIAKLSQHYATEPEFPKSLFSRALILKNLGKYEEARLELEKWLVHFPQFEQKAQVLFELVHLDHQTKTWASCFERAKAFLSQFPNHELSLYAWRYLASALAELAAEKPLEKAMKEQLLAVLRQLLEQPFSPPEHADWEFLSAKTHFELGDLKQAAEILHPLLASGISFSQEANGYLLLALCYRDGKKDIENFCALAEKAITKKATLIAPELLHTSLFNSYLDRSSTHPEFLEKCTEHLYAVFVAKGAIQLENLLWLAESYCERLKKEEEMGAPPTLSFAEQGVAVLESIANRSDLPSDPEARDLFLELISCKLGKLYSLLGKKEKAISTLEALLHQYRSSPNIAWKWEKEGELLLAEIYVLDERENDALELFEDVSRESSTLRTAVGASACLQGARLRLARWAKQQGDLNHPDLLKVLAQFKDLVLQKTLTNEPLHLEAALDYVELQTRLDTSPNTVKKRLALLEKTKEDFETTRDLLSKDYHEARAKFPRKNQIYQSYMRFIDAEILAAKSLLSETPEAEKELQAKARGLLLQIVEEKSHPALVTRAMLQLQKESSANGSLQEQKA